MGLFGPTHGRQVERMTSPREIIDGLSDPFVESLLKPHFSDIDTVAAFLGIDEGYLSVQLRLMLPQYDESDLRGREAVDVVREVLVKLRHALADFEGYYRQHRARNQIDRIPAGLKLKGRRSNLRLDADNEALPVIFDRVNERDGFEIQDRIHYIHQARPDTQLHLGLFLPDADFPACYCALSECDREYQRAALSAAVGTDIPMSNIAVMTRAYGYTPLPKNMMSKLFDLTARELQKNEQYDYIITALNPFLGFSGSIFLGASYVPFARSPMVYHYTAEGLYTNRRGASDRIVQQYSTPPIVWLCRDLKSMTDDPWNGKIIDIKPEAYSNG